METKSKTGYINAWNEHIKEINALAFCADEELQEQVRNCVEKLLKLVPKVAETKDLDEE